MLKLYRCLRKTEKTQPRQLVFYDPGVGTLERPDPWHKLKQDFNAILGLATGYGLDDNVLAAYAFLVANYQDGDQIYLFGFSRGAYTVRVLAGLIHKVGLISPQQVNLAGSGLIAYKQFSSDVVPKLGAELARPHRRRRRGRADRGDAVRQRGAVRAHHLDAMADHQIRRRLGYGGERHRPPRRPAVLAEPGRTGVHAAKSERADFPPGDLDRRAPLHVPPQEVGRAANLHP